MEKTGVQKRGWILVALMLTMMLAAMDITIVSTAIPQIVSDLGGFSKFTWVFSIYLLAQTVTIPLYGKLSDMYGRKPILIFGITVFLIGSVTSAMAWDIGSLITFRGIQGLGAGSIMATVNTIAGDIYSVKERAKIQGYLSSVWGVSAILGPALGGALTEFINWRWIFLINLPVGALSIFFLLAFFKEKIVPVKPVIDYKGALLIMCTLGLLLVFLLEGGQSWAWFSWSSFGLLMIIIILGIWTYSTERRSPHAIMPAWVWKNRTLAFTNFAMMGMGVVMMGPETFLPTYTQAYLGLGIIASGFVLASMSIGWPTASALSGRLYLRIGFRETSMIGVTLLFIACIWFLFLPRPQPIYLIVLNQIFMGAGFGLLSTPSLVGTQSMVSWEQRGVVTSANVFSRNLGQSLGATLVGAIFNNSILQQIKDAPVDLTSATNNVMEILYNPEVSVEVKEYLRESIDLAMSNVYWGLSFFTVIIFLCLYRVPPRDANEKTIDLDS
jgi:EmrB/QacA subfamily drug resistance transporter